MWVFLQAYDQYVAEIQERARQLVAKKLITTEAVSPANLKFCADPEWLELTIALRFIDDVETVKKLTDNQLRKILDSKAEESKEGITLEKLDTIVKQELGINTQGTNATSKPRTSSSSITLFCDVTVYPG